MRIPFEHWDERTRELAVDELTHGLSRPKREDLLSRVDADEFERLELCAAALSLAELGPLEAPPAELRQKLAADARAYLQDAQPAPAAARLRPVPAKRESTWLVYSGWIAAAALLLVFVSRSLPDQSQDPASRREVLMSGAPDLLRAEWVLSADPLAGTLNGDVVWSRERQEGYLRFRDLAANDPGRRQYQLWIFDKSRAEWEAKPVDGGVFDVTAAGEVVVPINAKLEVREAALFALTLEVPGGVVVSAREHLLATAAP